jgi:hypothetical protein
MGLEWRIAGQEHLTLRIQFLIVKWKPRKDYGFWEMADLSSLPRAALSRT